MHKQRVILGAVIIDIKLETSPGVLENLVQNMQRVDQMVKRAIRAVQNLQKNSFKKGGNLCLQMLPVVLHQKTENTEAQSEHALFGGEGVFQYCFAQRAF